MAKKKNKNNISTPNTAGSNTSAKVKRKRKSVPRDSPSQRSSIYRGVTRHRCTGRYEAHLWDKHSWNESQNKKGRQVYLGAYDDETAAAHAYDLAALKYWGHHTILNFPLTTYQEELKEMEGQSKEEYIGSLRRKSSGFSRGVSKYRGVARHHHNGRWEARIGRVFGNKYLYLGTYATQEEAATAYDMAAIEYRGLNAVTNFDLSRYVKWLRPDADNGNPNDLTILTSTPNYNNTPTDPEIGIQQEQRQPNVEEVPIPSFPQPRAAGAMTSSSALGLLFQSSKFQEMLEMTSSAIEGPPSSPPKSGNRPSRCSFPEDIQTYFECEDTTGSYGDVDDDAIFGDIIFASPIYQLELDA